MILAFSLALAMASPGTPAHRSESRGGSRGAQEQSADRVGAQAPADVRTAAASNRATSDRPVDRSQPPPVGGAARLDFANVTTAIATAVMAIIAGLQLAAFYGQRKMLTAQGEVIKGHVDAMKKVAHETEMQVTATQLQTVTLEKQVGVMEVMVASTNELKTAITRLENRLTTMQDVLKARRD